MVLYWIKVMGHWPILPRFSTVKYILCQRFPLWGCLVLLNCHLWWRKRHDWVSKDRSVKSTFVKKMLSQIFRSILYDLLEIHLFMKLIWIRSFNVWIWYAFFTIQYELNSWLVSLLFSRFLNIYIVAINQA